MFKLILFNQDPVTINVDMLCNIEYMKYVNN